MGDRCRLSIALVSSLQPEILTGDEQEIQPAAPPQSKAR